MTTVEYQAYTSADAAAQTTITLSTRAAACTRDLDYSNECRRSAVKLPGLSARFSHCSSESTRISRVGTRSQLERAPSTTNGACYFLNVQHNSTAFPTAAPRYNKAASVRLGRTCTRVRPDARVRWRHRLSCLQARFFNSVLRLQLFVFVLFCAASPCASKSLTVACFRRHTETHCTCRFRTSGVATYGRAELSEGRVGSIFGEGPCNVGAPARCGFLLVTRNKAESRTRAHRAAGTSRRHVEQLHHQGKHTTECTCVRSHLAGEGESRSELAFLRASSANSADVFTWYTACRKAKPPANPEKGGCRQQSDKWISAPFVTAVDNPAQLGLQSLLWLSCGAASQAPTCTRLRQRPCAHKENAISLHAAAVRAYRHGRRRFLKSACQTARNNLLLVPSHLFRSALRSESCASHRNTKSRATGPTHSDAGISCFSPDVGTGPCSGGLESGTPTSVEAERERQSPSGSEFLRGVDAAWNVCADLEWKTYSREQLLSDSNQRWTSSDEQDKGVKKWVLYNVQRFPADVLSCSPTSGRLRAEQMRERDAHLERVAGEKAAAGEVEARQSKKQPERQRFRKLTWKDYLSWLPPPQPQHSLQRSSRHIRNFQETSKCEEPGDQTSFNRSRMSKEEEDAYNEWEGFPPSASTRIDDLPLESLIWSNMTILYRQPFKEAPMIVDEETFRRLESRWTDAELKRVQREEKDAYGIPEDVPDDCWIPISPSIPEGRLVQEYGLLPNVTLTAGGYDYIETYHDPERNYTWSYKRWNPLKQEGEPPRNLEAEARSIYELETERSRRYWHEEAHPPSLKPDDGIFRQATIADEMIKGMKRTPLGMDQWHYTPTHPLGQAAELQNFWLTAVKSTLSEATTRVAAEARTGGAAVRPAVLLSKNGLRSLPVPSDFTSEQALTMGLPVSVRFPAAEDNPAAESDAIFRRVSSEAVVAAESSGAPHLQPGVKVVPHLTCSPLAVLAQSGPRNGGTGARELPVLEEHELQRDHAANTSCKRCKTASETETIIHEAVGELSTPTTKALAQLEGAAGVTATPTKSAPGAKFTYRSGARTFRVNRSAYQPLVFSEAGNGDLGATGSADGMKYRRLGRSDLFVSEVGLGTMTVGSPPLNENRTKQLLTYAVDVWGVNFIDTAELYPLPAAPHTYGTAEEIIGQWLRSTGRRSGRGREELIIATKVAGPSSKLAWLRSGGNSCVYPPERCSADEEPQEATRRRQPDAGGVFVSSRAQRTAERAPGAWTKSCRRVGNAYEGTSLSKTQIVQAAEGSLRRLQTDYIDLFQLHWPDRYVPMQSSGDAAEVLYDPEEARLQQTTRDGVGMEEQLDAVRDLLRQGKIRAWGLCNETPYGVCRFTRLATKIGLPPPASVQLQYNLLCRNDVEKGFVELARPQNAGTGLLAYGALAGGILTGKYFEWLEKPTTGRMLRFPSYMKRYSCLALPTTTSCGKICTAPTKSAGLSATGRNEKLIFCTGSGVIHYAPFSSARVNRDRYRSSVLMKSVLRASSASWSRCFFQLCMRVNRSEPRMW